MKTRMIRNCIFLLAIALVLLFCTASAFADASLVPENGNNTWTWYMGLSRDWSATGVRSDSSIIQFRIPDQYWSGSGVGLPVWTITNNHDLANNPYDFTIQAESWNDGRGIMLLPAWKVDQETMSGSNTYTVRAEYNGMTFESTETINFTRPNSYPTGLTMTVYEADLATNTAGAAVPMVNGAFTLETGKNYVFTSTYTGSTPPGNYFIYMNGSLNGALTEYPRYSSQFQNPDGTYVWSHNQQVFAAGTPGTYNFFPSLSISMSNLLASNQYTIRITDASGNVPNPRMDTRELTWYTNLPTDWPENGGIYSLSSFGQMWSPESVRDYSDLNISWQLVCKSGPDNFELFWDPWNEWLDSYFYAEVKPKSGSLTPGDTEYTMLCTYKGVTYEGTLLIHTASLSPLPTGMTLDVAEFNPDTQAIGSYTTVRNGGNLNMQTGKSYVLRGLMAGSSISADSLWLNLSSNNGWIEKDRWEYRDSQGNDIFHGYNMVVEGGTPGVHPDSASLTLENSNLEVIMKMNLRVADASGNVPVTKPILNGNYPWTDGYADTIDYTIYTGVPLDSNQRVWTNGGYIHLFITNWEALMKEYGESPVWNVKQTSGNMTWSVSSDDKMIWSQLDAGAVASPSESVFEVSCTWGPETTTKTINVHVVQPDFTLPEDLINLPDTIRTKVGETLTLTPEAVPSAQTYGGIAPDFFAANGLGDFADQSVHEGKSGTFIIRDPGIYTDVVGLRIGSIMVTKTVTFEVADESGKIPALVPENGNSTWTWYMGLDRGWTASGVRSDSGIIQFRIPEEYWAGPEVGLPVWTVTNNNNLANNPYDFTWERESWNDGRGISLQPAWDVDQETVAGDNTYTIRAEYNGKTFESTETVIFTHPASYPTGITMTVREADLTTNTAGAAVPMTDGAFTLETGKDYVFTTTYTGSTPPGNYYIYMNGSLSGALEEYGRYEEQFWIPDVGYVWADNQQVFAAGTPGTYDFYPTLSIGMSNLEAGGCFTIRIADESGNVPALVPENGNSTYTWYTGLDRGWTASGVRSYSDLLQLRIPEEYWVGPEAGLPVWTVTNNNDLANNPYDFTWETEDWNDGRGIRLITAWTVDQETLAGSNTYTVRAEYNGMTFESTETINFTHPASIPTGMGLMIREADLTTNTAGAMVPIKDGAYTLEAGKDYVFTSGYTGTIPSETDTTILNGSLEGALEEYPRYSDRFREPDGSYAWADNQLVFAAVTPGTYDFYPSLCINMSNLMAYGHFTIRITDTGAQTLKPDLSGEYPWADRFADTFDYTIYTGVPIYSSNRVWTDEAFIHLFIMNREVLKAEYGGSPTWKVTQTSGSLNYSINSNDMMIWSHLDPESLASPTEAVFKVSCTWGPETVEKTINVHVVQPDFTLPADLSNLPDIIRTKVGETVTLAPEAVPAAQTYGGIAPSFFYTDMDPFAECIIYSDDSGTFRINTPGTYTALIGLRIGSLMVTKPVTFVVAAAGAPTLTFGGEYHFGDYRSVDETMTYYRAGDIELDGEKDDVLYSSSGLFYYGVMNPEDIPADAGEPSYSVRLLSGGVQYEINARDEDYCFDVHLKQMPPAGEAVFEVSYTVAGQTETQEVHIVFTDLPSRPAGLESDFPPITVMKKGDSFPFDPPIRFTGGWCLNDHFIRLYGQADDGFWNDAVNWEERTVGNSGVYDVQMFAMTCNLWETTTVRLIFTEADGTIPKGKYTPIGTAWTLPANLTRIESEAFAGIPMKEVDIPESVTWIANDAFDGCGLVAIYAHNQYVVDYAVSHNIVAIVD